jgi:hypothetical protein
MRFFYLTLILLTLCSNCFSQIIDRTLLRELDTANATCGNNNGEIHLIVVKGVGPYQYSIDNRLPPTWQNTGDFIGLAPGEYTTTVKDLTTGTMAIQPVHLTSGCLTANVVVKNATCGINNGVITITAANGTAPYQYSINGVNFQSSNVFNDLSPEVI